MALPGSQYYGVSSVVLKKVRGDYFIQFNSVFVKSKCTITIR